MSGKENKSKFANTIQWILGGFRGHAEKQVSKAHDLHAQGMLSEELQKKMKPWIMSHKDKEFAKEHRANLEKTLSATESFIKDKVFPRISAPKRTAQLIGYESDGQARVRRYHIIGDPELVVCTKHCGPKSTSTKGFNYHVEYDNGLRDVGLLCEKCVSELSDKKNRGRLAALLGLKKSDSNRSQGRSSRSSTSDKADKLLEMMNGPSKLPKSEGRPVKQAEKLVDLYDLAFTELRLKAREKGISPLPRSKAAMIAALEAHKD